MVLRFLANLNTVIRGIRLLKVSRKRLATIGAMVLVILTVTITGILIPGGGSNEQATVTPEPTPTSHNGQKVVPTNMWVSFYSLESTLDGQPLSVGSMITVYDPQRVFCGEFLVKQAGRYGLMAVYGDDETTESDEGALPGDELEFYINGFKATLTGPDEVVWTATGDLKQVNLAASSAQ
jgi:hypothetical protein